MERIIKSSPRYFFTFAVISMLGIFIAIILFGISASMPMHPGEQMSGCPFMAQTASICTMTAVEHIASWQQLFATTVPSAGVSLLILAAFVLTIVLGKQRLRKSAERGLARIHEERNSEVKLVDYLRRLFSDGVLNPKIYELAF